MPRSVAQPAPIGSGQGELKPVAQGILSRVDGVYQNKQIGVCVVPGMPQIQLPGVPRGGIVNLQFEFRHESVAPAGFRNGYVAVQSGFLLASGCQQAGKQQLLQPGAGSDWERT